jgi:hypothetical protein
MDDLRRARPARPKQPPPILYKYCPPKRFRDLESKRIRFTQNRQLNDVFEMKPLVWFDPELTAAAKQLVPGPWPPPHSQAEQEALIDSTLDCALSLCLSNVWNNPLMWAYYADGHKGFVIGFDTKNAALFPEPPRAVAYSRSRPTIGYGKSFDDSVYTKARYWEHEREWRAIRVEEYPDPIHLVSFPPEAIKEVILGDRMCDSLQDLIATRLRGDYKHVRLYQLVPDKIRWVLKRAKIPLV